MSLCYQPNAPSRIECLERRASRSLRRRSAEGRVTVVGDDAPKRMQHYQRQRLSDPAHRKNVALKAELAQFRRYETIHRWMARAASAMGHDPRRAGHVSAGRFGLV